MDFPYEIWLNIARFIPSYKLLGLYSINRALFDIAMDERFKRLRFCHRKTIISNVRFLRRYKHHAQRVRRLEIWPQIIPKLADVKSASKWKRIHNAIARQLTGQPNATAQAIAAMVAVVSEMTNVTEYVHRYRDCPDLPDLITFAPVVKASWAAFGHNLQSMTLNVALEGCEYILSPPPTFLRLKHLVINIFRAYRTTDCPKIMSSLLVPFVNNHHATLQSFEVSAYDYIDLCVLFIGLQRLSNLTNLTIDYPFASLELSDTTGLNHLLQTHSSDLQALSLQFRPAKDISINNPLPSEWFQQDFLHVQLPGLQSLDLGIEYFAGDLHRTAGYLKQYQSSLTTLVLRSVSLTLSEVNTLLGAFSGMDYLRKLDIDVFQFSPDLLDQVAMRAPSLHRLELEFDHFSSALELDYFPVISEPSRQLTLFCEALRTHNYVGWKLRHLKARPLGPISGDMSGCRVAISEALPGLETLQLERSGFDLKR